MRRKTNTGLIQSSLCLIVFLSVFTACKTPVEVQGNCLMPGDASDPSNPEMKECIIPEPEQDATLEINANLQSFSDDQEVKMKNALDRLKLVINSIEFKQRVLGHTYQDEEIFYDNQGLTNLEIYEKIMLGSETLNIGEDQQMDIDITLYYKNNSTVGYTYPNTTRIWVNYKFFSTYSLGQVAANVAHEWTHKLGFEHDFNRTTRRNYSVPYAVGTIIKELIDNM